MNTFGDRLKSLIEQKEITQLALSKILNVSDATVNRYVKNINFPGEDTLKKIADYFEVSVDYLLCRTDNPNYSVVSTNYKGKSIELVVNSKTVNYTQEQIQSLIDKLSEMYVDVDKLINK